MEQLLSNYQFVCFFSKNCRIYTRLLNEPALIKEVIVSIFMLQYIHCNIGVFFVTDVTVGYLCLIKRTFSF
jgi:hypothetical protein